MTIERRWIEQKAGTRYCGQVAVAVIAGITLEEAIKVVGKKGCTKTSDLVKALRKLGYKCPDRCQRLKKSPPLAIGHLKNPERASGWHWVVIDGKKIYDGINGTPDGTGVRWKPGWKLTSFLPISK